MKMLENTISRVTNSTGLYYRCAVRCAGCQELTFHGEWLTPEEVQLHKLRKSTKNLFQPSWTTVINSPDLLVALLMSSEVFKPWTGGLRDADIKLWKRDFKNRLISRHPKTAVEKTVTTREARSAQKMATKKYTGAD
ncbi:unnamed protein product [Protopolystoma xenopodis]|uniref:Uncharacterized protein n=1 Tax=Protopolystoma xenopodis TaxID=117903 RepID=A0A448XDE5_9PLAT|nr:unnamed protein product [Protopolystoma xenopodis]